MASRFLRTAAVTAAGTLCAAAVVALPTVITVGGSSASAADSCPSPSTSPSASSSPSPDGGPGLPSELPSLIPGGSPSPSSSASSPSATPSASISPCPSPSASSPSATATATISATPTASMSPSCNTLTVKINTPTINATGLASVTVTGAPPGSRIELQGYSQNHSGTASFANDTTNPDRVATADTNGAATFNDLRPASNTRLRARTPGCPDSASAVIDVRAQETLTVTRNGTRSYTFSGRSIPARPGGLIISLYRIVGTPCNPGVEPSKCPGEVFLAQARAVALGQPNQGLYRIKYTFAAKDQNVRDDFVVKTGQDAQNAPGRSNARSLLIY